MFRGVGGRLAQAWDALKGKVEAPPAAMLQRPQAPRRNYFDSAATGKHNQNHWAGATLTDADSAILYDLETLRKRARYEIWNNSYAKGIADTFANDVAGTGPLVQVYSDSDEENAEVTQYVEMQKRFAEWCDICDAAGQMTFAEMIRVSVRQFLDSGEALFGFQNALATDRNADYPVKLRLQMIEPDRLMTPWGMTNQSDLAGGIKKDAAGNPVGYYILKTHPGAAMNFADINAYVVVPAPKLIHLYRVERPGQSRGFPWITPSLELFAYMRRYALAVVDAAEKGADMAIMLETTAQDINPANLVGMSTLDIERGTMMVSPQGYKAQAFKSEQPTTTYGMFKAEILNEIARCLNMPYNVAAGNSSTYNYASGRLDHQTYFKAIGCIQEWISIALCDRVFTEWRREAQLLGRRYIRQMPRAGAKVQTAYYWDTQRHVDPVKEANGQGIELANRMTTYAAEYARKGVDYRTAFKQIAIEQQMMRELNITPAQVAKSLDKPEPDEDDSAPKEKTDAKA